MEDGFSNVLKQQNEDFCLVIRKNFPKMRVLFYKNKRSWERNWSVLSTKP